MNYNLNTFVSDIQNQNYAILNLDLNKNGRLVAILQNQLNNNGQAMDDKSIEEYVESRNFHGGRWTRFNIMITSFLQYCRDVNPWSSWDSSDLIFKYYSDLNNCLLNDSYPCEALVPVFIEVTEFIIPLARELDNHYLELKIKKHQFLSHTSMIISKLFNSIKSNSENVTEIFEQLPHKQRILLYLVNKLNNIYFRIESPQLCSNIFKNFKPKCSLANFSQFPINEQIEYRYLLGRYYLLNSRILNAFVQLNNSFRLLLGLTSIPNVNQTPQLQRNIKRILKFLIPTGILIGKRFRFDVLSHFHPEMVNMYSELQQNIRSGNLQKVNNWLKLYQADLLEANLLLILLEKLPMVTYKYLIKHLIVEWSLSQGFNRLPYDLVSRALRLSIGKDDYFSLNDSTTTITIFNGIHSSDNVENVLVTLINLGYLRGNCFPSMRLCVFKKTNNISDIMPAIEERITSMFPLNDDDSWLED
ncbi:similar to Saccharomyces cerevisiae YOL072W THP1 Nuclear pore-associated protein [Maudiozyma barnettii]|uniref:Similar to Saccharomyces cerevisiae YOL072W THP1 Nuclear pore-associated protein n=1 Tax=Maudiozyma barnettii TaxID=61262 RepID=A0A8H2ZML6_9SACH|nr:Thp1p [Kazachstania barnettii]CAB4257212.1 similar to Saccharomyces cerevisiae YOL072W THP1 Nuclear pore-associated protein [Kazachstania barnettii]CAD1779582.1 similar to Saccharomyces cerevisiae YOL072W THP1 Nuclear pore-associated protein [Kazachstania barnettii]